MVSFKVDQDNNYKLVRAKTWAVCLTKREHTNIDIYKCMKHFQKHRKINMEQSTFVKSPRSGRVKVGLKRRKR